MFAGVFAISRFEDRIDNFICPLTGVLNEAGRDDRYETIAVGAFEAYASKLLIDWGFGHSFVGTTCDPARQGHRRFAR